MDEFQEWLENKLENWEKEHLIMATSGIYSGQSWWAVNRLKLFTEEVLSEYKRFLEQSTGEID